MAELTWENDCCATGEQATCCGPEEKNDCCDSAFGCDCDADRSGGRAAREPSVSDHGCRGGVS